MEPECPFHGKLTFKHLHCEPGGECFRVFECPECGISLFESEWEKIREIVWANGIHRSILLEKPVLLKGEDIAGFEEDWRIATYAGTLGVLLVKLRGGELYYTVKFDNRKRPRRGEGKW